MKKNILVSGSSGQLGSELQVIAAHYPQFNFVFKTKESFNLESQNTIQKVLQADHYDYFINAGAYTNVDKAESEEEKCFTINARALKWIAEYASDKTQIIHISSDYVYNINKTTPLVETDDTRPKGIYALSKLLGEELLKAIRPDSIIIRTSWVYSSFGHNFVKTMLRLGDRDALDIVSDQIGAPTYARDLATAIMQIITKISDNPESDYGGIYNYSNGGRTNWADYARKIFELSQQDCKVNDTTTKAYNAPAHRPLWSVLSKDKIKASFDVKINAWDESLAICLSELKNSL